jgi:tetratricopeptide (TPR) repeat protein
MTVRVAFTTLLLGAFLVACGSGVQPPEPPADVAEPLVAGRIAAATAAVREALNSADAWGRLGTVYDVHVYFDRALECYDRASELDPDEFRWPYFSGIVLRENDQAAALRAFARAVELKPDYAPLRLYLGFGHFLEEHIDEAAKHYERALQLDERSVNARIGLARVAQASQRLDDAVELLEQARAIAPEEAAVHHHLAHVYGLRGDKEKAALERKLAETSAVAMQPGEMASFHDPVRDEATLAEGVSSNWLLTNGQRHLAAGRVEEAGQAFDAVLEANPDSVPGLLASSRYALGTGNAERALELVRRAVELAPGDAATHADLGLVLARVNQLPQAIAAYEQALAIDPNLPDARSNLATLLFQTGRTDEGTGLLREAAAAYPGRPDIQQNLANVLLMTGQEEAAAQVLRDAIAVNATDAGLRHMLGVVLTFQGKVEDSVAMFREALEIDPGNAEVHTGLAIGLWELKRYAEAMDSYRAALRHSPNDPAAVRDYAWALAVCPQDDLRDGAEALQLAQQLNQQSQFSDPRYLDVLAVAQAETGDFAQAVASLDKALQIVNTTLARINGQLDPRQEQAMRFFAAGLNQRRALFDGRGAYREP